MQRGDAVLTTDVRPKSQRRLSGGSCLRRVWCAPAAHAAVLWIDCERALPTYLAIQPLWFACRAPCMLLPEQPGTRLLRPTLPPPATSARS